MNDLDTNCILREKEVAKRKARMCRKLDSLFSRAYSLGLVTGSLTPSTLATPQDVLIAAISLDQAFLRSAALADEKTVGLVARLLLMPWILIKILNRQPSVGRFF